MSCAKRLDCEKAYARSTHNTLLNVKLQQIHCNNIFLKECQTTHVIPVAKFVVTEKIAFDGLLRVLNIHFITTHTAKNWFHNS